MSPRLKAFLKPQFFAFVFAMAMVPALFMLLQRSTNELVDSRRLVEHTYTVLNRLDLLRLDIEGVETARRGYLIMHQEQYLQPFYFAKQRIPEDLSTLQTLTKDNRSQQAHLTAIMPIIDELVTTAGNNIAIPPHDAVASMTHAKAILDRARQMIERMQVEENRLLTSRSLATEQKLYNLKLLLWGMSIGFIFLLIILFVSMYREIIERRRVELGLIESQAFNEMTVYNLSLMSEMTSLLQACSNTEESLDVIRQFAARLLSVDAGVLYLFRESRNQVEASINWGAPAKSEVIFQPDDCWALRRGEEHRFDAGHNSLACKHLYHDDDIFSLCIPIVAQGNVLGVLHLENHGTLEISSVERNIAVNLASQIALALASIKLRDTLRNLSVRDPLTGLFNRRYMEESLQREIATAQRKSRPLGLVILDLDHFKKFNDTFGHDAGDMLLREVGALLAKNSRAGDIACRFGGEEFVMIYPEAPPEMVQELANQLRQLIYALQLQHYGRSLGQVSASFGLAFFPAHGSSGEELLRNADKALYRAKAAGRNRLEIADAGNS
ncbi:MAG: diguanylate cyclase [Methylophilaceae bacterium]